MTKILSSIACNLDTNILSAALPLFSEGCIEGIEWSFDTLNSPKKIPPFFQELLNTYGNEKKLIGHGVFFSLFSGRLLKDQKEWLSKLKQMSSEFTFDHITEHFGFMTGKNFHQGAPLNIPYSKTTLEIGRDRLARISEACSCPVGLENLAFSYSLDEVKKHGEFLERLIEPFNGFIILDLHNLYCQLKNFSVSYDDIIDLYPLNRVREIHISGGSWEDSNILPKKSIRRDTHDEMVPSEVFELLDATIEKCPELKYVVLEQIGTGLQSEESKKWFQKDFLKMAKIVSKKNQNRSSNTFLPAKYFSTKEVIEDEVLYQQQIELSEIFENADSLEGVLYYLSNSSLANTYWNIESWDKYMIETAIKIAKKWK